MSDEANNQGGTNNGEAINNDSSTTGNTNGEISQAVNNGDGVNASGESSGASEQNVGGDILDDLNTNGNQNNQEGNDGISSNVPEQYEQFNVPDGMAMDENTFNKFSSVAKEMGLTQENAQKLVDLQTELQQQKSQESSDLIAGWRKSSKELFAGKPEVSTFVTKTFQERPELGTVLRETGIINHPEVMKLVVDYGKALSEDVFGGGGTSSSGNKSVGEILYPNSKK